MDNELESEEEQAKERLLLGVLNFLRANAKFPEVGAFRSEHLAERSTLDSLTSEGLLRTEQGHYRLTLNGLLKIGAQEAKVEFALFDELLPHLKEAYRQNAGKPWQTKELASIAPMTIQEITRTLALFVPEMKFWSGLNSSTQGQINDLQLTERILETEPFGDVESQIVEKEGIGVTPRIVEIRISGYRALEGFSAQLGPLTVIIGANASGKSSLLDFLAFLSFAAASPLPPNILDPHSAGKTLFHAGSPAKRISFDLHLKGEPDRELRYAAKILGPIEAPTVLSEKLVSVHDIKGEPQEVFTFLDFNKGRGIARRAGQLLQRVAPLSIAPNELALRRGWGSYTQLPTLEDVCQFITSWRFYNGFKVGVTAKIRYPVPTEYEPTLNRTGSNLSAVLAYIHSEHRDRWEELETHLRSAIPSFKSLGIKFKEQRGTVIGTWREDGVNGELTLADLSDGTLQFLCWATLCLAQKPPLLCIDEPEVGLHPRVLPVLGGLLRQAAAESQILVSTHSPYLLSQFPLDSIAVMKKIDGRATFARPASNEALKREIEELGSEELARLHSNDELEARS